MHIADRVSLEAKLWACNWCAVHGILNVVTKYN